MKAIETLYRGYRFRSRLEARWAVFFDALGIEWEYEYEGYEFDGKRWLPDFFIPAFGLHVEVKPSDLSGREEDVARALEVANGCGLGDVLFACGVPDLRPYPLARCTLLAEGEPSALEGAFVDKYMPRGTNGKHGEQRLYYLYDGEKIRRHEFGPMVEGAVIAARQARFEHGQVGAPRNWARSPA